VVRGDVGGAHAIVDKTDQAGERVTVIPVAPFGLALEVAAKRLPHVVGLGMAGARGETLERAIARLVEVELLPPYTAEYTLS